MAKTNRNIVNEFEYGKLPPQAIDMEEAVLGACMLERDAIYTVGSLLTAEMFYKQSHQLIYQAIIDLQIKSAEIDILTVTEQLRIKDELDIVGGPYYITQLASKVSSAAHINEHARYIIQRYISRRIIQITSEYQSRAYDESIDVKEVIDALMLDIMNIEHDVVNEPEHVKVQAEKNLDYIEDLLSGKINPYGIRTKLRKLDRVTGGIQKDYILIAARPSMGKTSFTIQLVNNICIDQAIPTALFELEMSKNRIVRWLISQRTGIYNEHLRTVKGYIKLEDLSTIENATAKIMDAPLFIDDTPAINILQLRSKLIKLKHTQNIELAIVDYLQLMSGVSKYNNRNEVIGAISRGIKQIQKELNIPIIALSQMNREVERRPEKRPKLADLRESGDLEQDPDTVIFIHRPEKYGLEHYDNGESTEGIAELIFAKHRDGGNDIVQVRFDKKTVSFKNIEENNPNQFIELSNENEEPF